MIRVRLSRLNLSGRVDLYPENACSVESAALSASFPEGSHLILEIRSGHILLCAQGILMDAGTSLRVISHGDRGVRFSKKGNHYPGILDLTISEDRFEALLTLPLETYLRGVVPYEMGSGFPLEALKAQAVCARTYAMKKLNTRKDQDVTDTTNDQVFRGLSDDNSLSDRAILETAGIVGMWQGQLATCYYAASNGGQTDLESHAWDGSRDSGLYQVREDPYDLANPLSVVLRCIMKKDASDLPEPIRHQIYLAFMPTLPSMNLDPREESFRIDSLESLDLSGRPLGEENQYVTDLTLYFTFSGRPLMGQGTEGVDEELLLFSTPTPAPSIQQADSAFGPMTHQTGLQKVTLAMFPDLISQLNLSIPGTGRELLSVKDTGDAFSLESRRYGHGVGMSQRGAQYMGENGFTYDQILGFYYPGMELRQSPSATQSPATPQPLLASTPAPTPSPTPRPTLMPVTLDLPENAYLASVEFIAEDSTLNLRSQPSQVGTILMRLLPHQVLQVLETCPDPLWVHVRTDTVDGYVMQSFLQPLSAP